MIFGLKEAIQLSKVASSVISAFKSLETGQPALAIAASSSKPDLLDGRPRSQVFDFGFQLAVRFQGEVAGSASYFSPAARLLRPLSR